MCLPSPHPQHWKAEGQLRADAGNEGASVLEVWLTVALEQHSSTYCDDNPAWMPAIVCLPAQRRVRAQSMSSTPGSDGELKAALLWDEPATFPQPLLQGEHPALGIPIPSTKPPHMPFRTVLSWGSGCTPPWYRSPSSLGGSVLFISLLGPNTAQHQPHRQRYKESRWRWEPQLHLPGARARQCSGAVLVLQFWL